MKKILQLSLLCATVGIGSLSLTSCSSSEYDATPEIPGRDTIKNDLRGEFTATVDGTNFIAEMKGARIHVSEEGIKSISIYGTMDSYNKDPETNQTIVLSIADYQGPNIYPIQFGNSGTYVVKEKDKPTRTYLAKTGDSALMIQITADNDNLEGNFNFVVAPDGIGDADNHSITSGKFTVPKK
jgi:hypothetical protein